MKQSHRQAATAAPGAGPVEGPAWTPGLVSYMTPESESSLYRNGKVFTRRDRDGNDAGDEGVVTEELTVAIGDARSLEGGRRRTLDVHGFELLDRPLARPGLDFYSPMPAIARASRCAASCSTTEARRLRDHRTRDREPGQAGPAGSKKHGSPARSPTARAATDTAPRTGDCCGC